MPSRASCSLRKPQAGLELLPASDPDFAPTATAAGDGGSEVESSDNSKWAGLGPDGTCEPWKRSPRKKKLCVTYRFDPHTQAKEHCQTSVLTRTLWTYFQSQKKKSLMTKHLPCVRLL